MSNGVASVGALWILVRRGRELALLILMLFSLAANAACERIEVQRQAWAAELTQLIDTRDAFRSIAAGTIPRTLRGATLFSFAIDSDAAVAASRTGDSPYLPLSVIDAEACPDSQVDIQELKDKLLKLRMEVSEYREQWLRLPVRHREGLQHVLRQWPSGIALLGIIEENALVSEPYTRLARIGEQWEVLMGALAQLLVQPDLTAKSQKLWLDILALPDPNDDLPLVPSDMLERHATELGQVLSRQKALATYVRNLWVREGAALDIMESPVAMLTHELRELRWMLPVLNMHFVQPLMFDYHMASTEKGIITLVSGWALQVLLLILAIVGLLRLATASTRALSQLQRTLLGKLGHSPSMRILNAMVWVVKPNIAWLIIWLLALEFTALMPANWHIFRLLGPWGICYAMFRAVRVLSEWLLARMHSRVDQFVSQSAAVKMHYRAGGFALVTVVGWGLIQLLAATGGGLLYRQLSLLLVLVLWCMTIVTLRQYSPVSEKFISLQPSGAKATERQAALGRYWVLPFWPLLFLLVQGRDMVQSLHLKLSQFESYRTLSLRLLRLRLETTITSGEEGKEDDEFSPYLAKSYRYWLLERDTDEQPLITLEQTLALISEPAERWYQSDNPEPNVLLLCGDHGAGKTRLARQLVRQQAEWSIGWVNIPAKCTSVEAIRNLMENLSVNAPEAGPEEGQSRLSTKRLVVLDQTENLLVSQIGYLDAVREFFQILQHADPQTFYLVIMHGPTWQYLSRVFRQEHPFQVNVSMPRWSASEIRKLILSRHHASGRRLQYDDLLLSAMAGTEASSFRAADSRVFNLLWELCSGNPEVALHLWLSAASFEEREVVIALPQRPSSAFLTTLSSETCFVLRAIMIHKALTADEIALVTTIPLLTIEQILNLCVNQGVLIRDEEHRYRIQALWHLPVTTLLNRKNMLYG